MTHPLPRTIALLAATLCAIPALARPHQKERPRVEMVFVLDTTGSMGGLLEGAKQKIWSIVNEVAKGRPTPEIRVGLVAYRDRGDAYVSRVSQLTGDLDAVYHDLMALQADGGGDGPEDVNSALAAAVGRIEWSGPSARALRVIFLVGDAPPHTDYQDVPSYQRSVRRARQRGIVVNTIRCGTWAETGMHFRRIASMGGGTFLTIEQNGGMVAVRTPYDDELTRLSARLDRTFVLHGRAEERKEARRALATAGDTALAAGAPAAASRAIFRARAKAPAAPAPAAEADLVTAYIDGGKGAVAGTLEDERSLPAELRGLTLPEREAYLARKAEERRRIQARMKELAKEREAWMASHARRARSGFDARVLETIKTQAAAEAGIAYE